MKYKMIHTTKPDLTHGTSYPYENVEVEDDIEFEKFPFSPFLGRIPGVISCVIYVGYTNDYLVNLRRWNERGVYKSERFPYTENSETHNGLFDACEWAYDQMRDFAIKELVPRDDLLECGHSVDDLGAFGGCNPNGSCLRCAGLKGE